ncbi:MAG: hypothetical protein Q9216_004395 [Gyalolechia sp. 2 TL-2023]
MLGKRKRGQGPQQTQSNQTRASLLTQENLKAFDVLAGDAASIIKNYPSPFEAMSYQSPSSPKKSTSTTTKSTGLTKAERILDLYRFFLDRKKPLPTPLRNFIQQLKVPRQCDITPNSKNVKFAKEVNKGLSENMELHILVDKLVYRPKWFGQDDVDGEPLIYQGLNDQWADRIPRPPDAVSSTALAAAMDQLGLPKRPKPDISYGYGDDAFPDDLRACIDALPADLLVYQKKPWFPYMVVQWKSVSGTVREVEQQVRRDTSAAGDTIYRFFKHAQPHQEPSPADTCVFSLIVYARHCEYRIHWRRVDDEDGTISYEGDIIARAFLDEEDEIFKTRGVMLKTLSWARGSRLTAIQAALRALGSGPAVQEARPKWRKQIFLKPSVNRAVPIRALSNPTLYMSMHPIRLRIPQLNHLGLEGAGLGQRSAGGCCEKEGAETGESLFKNVARDEGEDAVYWQGENDEREAIMCVDFDRTILFNLCRPPKNVTRHTLYGEVFGYWEQRKAAKKMPLEKIREIDDDSNVVLQPPTQQLIQPMAGLDDMFRDTIRQAKLGSSRRQKPDWILYADTESTTSQ